MAGRTSIRRYLNDELGMRTPSKRLINWRVEQKKEAPRRGWGEVPAWVFTSATGTRLNVRSVEEDFKRLLTKAELSSHHTPHSARHIFATLLLRAGVPLEYVKRRLGHASISLTVDVYGKSQPDSDEAAWMPRPGQFWVDVLDTPTGNGSNLVATAVN